MNRPPGQRRQPRQGRGAVDAQFGLVLPALQEGGLHRRGVGGKRGPPAHAGRGFAQAGLEVGNRRGERTLARLQQRGREERVVHLLPQREERHAHAGLRFCELRAFEIHPRLDRRVEHLLFDPEVRVVGVLRRQEERRPAGEEGRRRRHVRLQLHLSSNHNRRLALGADVPDAKLGLGLLQLQLGEPRIRVDSGLLQGGKLQTARGRGPCLLCARVPRATARTR